MPAEKLLPSVNTEMSQDMFEWLGRKADEAESKSRAMIVRQIIRAAMDVEITATNGPRKERCKPAQKGR